MLARDRIQINQRIRESYNLEPYNLRTCRGLAAMAAPIQYGQYSVPLAETMVNFGVGQPAPSLLPCVGTPGPYVLDWGVCCVLIDYWACVQGFG